MKPPTIYYLSNIWFEPGAIALLPELLAQLAVKRPLLVTHFDLAMSAKMGEFALFAAVFDQIQTNPSDAAVNAGVEVYQQQQCDGVVAFGGGSPMDCAKCIALLATHP